MAFIIKGGVVAITGGAKGIGFAVAKAFAKSGMRVALADIDQAALNEASTQLVNMEISPNDILISVTDVSNLAEVQAFREAIIARFGETIKEGDLLIHGVASFILSSFYILGNTAAHQAFKEVLITRFSSLLLFSLSLINPLNHALTDATTVNILMNNAAISPSTTSWANAEQWKQLMAVNFTGVLNGQLAFVPHMISQGKHGAVINVGSKQGITNPPGNPAYSVSKAAVKTMTEQLAHDLRRTDGCKITAHLLVPGYTYTSLTTRGEPLGEKPAGAWTPDQVAERLIQGLTEGNFYIICPDNEVTWEVDQKRIQWAADDLVKNRPALSRWHPDFSSQFQEFLQQ